MNRLVTLVIFLNLLIPIATQPNLFGIQQASPVVTDNGVSIKFGEAITFKANIQSLTDVNEVLVMITPEGQPTVWQKMPLDQADAQGNLTLTVDARQIPLFPFAKVQYYYEAGLKNGGSVKSSIESFEYNDTRFNWETLNSGIFQIHWYGSDPALGQEIASIADQGLQQAQTLLKADLPAPVRLYAYTSASDLQAALQMTSQPWVSGHASPELGIILVSIPTGPEKKLELERQIPHEIMHLIQYQVMGKSYTQQPVWLVEGMASLAEVYPNPEYSRVLDATAKSHQLLPFSSLCTSFPKEANSAFQAYAQSESFVRFIQRKYGSSGLRNLIAQYQNGMGCEEGVAAALGTSLSQLEYRWQQEVLGVNVGGLVLSNLSPYLILGLVLLASGALVLIPRRTAKPHPSTSE